MSPKSGAAPHDRKPKPKSGGAKPRPMARHRLVLELEVFCADDYGQEPLAWLLMRQASAGLQEILTSVDRLELDGKVYRTPLDVSGLAVRNLRPPPDPRIGRALNSVLAAERELRAALGRPGLEEENTGTVG